MLRAAALAALTLLLAVPLRAQGVEPGCIGAVESATYEQPTDRYPHGALGDPFEWGAMSVTLRLTGCRGGRTALTLRLPDDLVFEDVRPLLADMDGDGLDEIATVESHRTLGARLTIWTLAGGTPARLSSTPFIGRSNRWMAQVGAADLDGDGRIEIAYVDRPHLAKQLRVWRMVGGQLVHVADLDGLTNHRFGETEMSGGIRLCGGLSEIVTADAGWRRVMLTRLEGGRLLTRSAGAYTPAALRAAMACR